MWRIEINSLVWQFFQITWFWTRYSKHKTINIHNYKTWLNACLVILIATIFGSSGIMFLPKSSNWRQFSCLFKYLWTTLYAICFEGICWKIFWNWAPHFFVIFFRLMLDKLTKKFVCLNGLCRICLVSEVFVSFLQMSVYCFSPANFQCRQSPPGGKMKQAIFLFLVKTAGQ